MGKLNEIRDRLLAGSTTKQLAEQGYSKSSVFAVAKKLKEIQPSIPALSIPDDLQELRHQREIIKLQKEIAELEAAKEKLPDRVAVLEKALDELRSLLNNAVNTALYVSLAFAGMDREEAKEFAQGWVGKNIKGQIGSFIEHSDEMCNFTIFILLFNPQIYIKTGPVFGGQVRKYDVNRSS